jgi:transposase
MSTAKLSGDFKSDTVHQIVERGYRVAEVSRRLGVSPHSLCAWKKRFAKSHSPDGSLDEQAAEVRRLKLEPARVTEERDILERATPSINGVLIDLSLRPWDMNCRQLAASSTASGLASGDAEPG